MSGQQVRLGVSVVSCSSDNKRTILLQNGLRSSLCCAPAQFVFSLLASAWKTPAEGSTAHKPDSSVLLWCHLASAVVRAGGTLMTAVQRWTNLQVLWCLLAAVLAGGT
jgi:hypothetical protein